MCGIVAYIGTRHAVPILVEGLKRLDYRGYDSAGLAVIRAGELLVRRAVGRISALEALPQSPQVHEELQIEKAHLEAIRRKKAELESVLMLCQG